ncbi:MAG: DUF3237 family protein [Blautia sp.]|nr:DUF3237 family protein [Blautia sp.]
MSTKPIMTFIIKVNPEDVTEFMAPMGGGACFIPFGGWAESELFSGKIRPGACDVQTVNKAGFRKMFAQYIFEGVDQAGQNCHIYVKNETYFDPAAQPGDAFYAEPTFITDSQALAPYLHTARFKSKGHGVDPETVCIEIFDLWDTEQDRIERKDNIEK